MTLGPGLRRFALTAHVTVSVGWLGAVAAFLALAVAGVTGEDARTVRAAYLAAEVATRYAIVPLSLAALATGLVQSLGTTWGLFRHYWVLAKLVLTLFAIIVLLQYTQTVSSMASVARQPELSGADRAVLRSPTFLVHAGGGLLVLLVTTTLSVYKPPGMTRFGRRTPQIEPRTEP